MSLIWSTIRLFVSSGTFWSKQRLPASIWNMGIFNLSVVLPQLVASFKMGEVVNNAADKSVVFAICMITLAISGVLWMFVKNEMPPKSPEGGLSEAKSETH